MGDSCVSLDDKIGNFGSLCWNIDIKGISLRSICYWGLSFVNEGYTHLKRIFKPDNPKCCYTMFPEITTETRAIVLFLHGINSDPSQFTDHFSLYEANKHFALFSPHIYMKGMISSQKCGERILVCIPPNIRDHNLKLIIVGFSNGGRIGLWLYPRLKPLFSQVYLTTIGSPLKGTCMPNLLLNSKLYLCTAYRNHVEVLKRLGTDSTETKELIAECQLDPQFTKNVMTYASKTDISVQPYTNAIIPDGSHKIIEGHGHNSMTPFLMAEQYKWCESRIYSNV
jgi:hypothetical protein